MPRVCGRFVSAGQPASIAEYFAAQPPEVELPANYNVAPTQDVYAVIAQSDGTRRLEIFHWGLVPSWAKDLKIGQKMINARAETLAEKPAFKSAFRKHRCIIPMTAFYEWRAGEPGGPVNAKGQPLKQPLYIERVDGHALAVAGLWAAWRDPAGGPDAPWLHSCTVVTTAANATMTPVHDRMPVILPPEAWQEWLDPQMQDLAELTTLLVPAPDDVLTMHAVSTDVNNVRNRGPF